MTAQENYWELNLPLYRSKFVFCGECAARHPYEDLHPIAKACGQHYEQAIFDVSDFDTVDVEPGYFTSLQFDDHSNADGGRDRWTREKFHRIRPGFLYAVVRNAPRINYVEFVAGVAERQPKQSQKKLDQIVNERLGYRRSTISSSHLGLVPLDDFEVSSVLTCWNCETRMAAGRGRLVGAVEHALKFGGNILVSRYSIDLRDSEVHFETRTHRRKKPTPPAPVSFRRVADFVVSQAAPE